MRPETVRKMRLLHAFVVVGLPLAGLPLLSVPLSAQVNSRSEEIQQARREKAAKVVPEALSTAESRLNYIVDNHILERFATGFHGLTMVMGGLPTGQGFALGP